MKKEKVLHLTLKRGWFDYILSGQKKEEYREIKPYWMKRLIDCNYPEETKGENKHNWENMIYDRKRNAANWNVVLKGYYSELKTFDVIEFRNGYGKRAATFRIRCKGITIGKPNDKWIDKATALSVNELFVIKLGGLISTKYINKKYRDDVRFYYGSVLNIL